MLINPAQANVYLVAVSSETPEYAGVFRSVDEGDSWYQLDGLEQKQVWALAFWRADARMIAAGAQDGVFLTRDGWGYRYLDVPFITRFRMATTRRIPGVRSRGQQHALRRHTTPGVEDG
jgi:hypothetical protein